MPDYPPLGPMTRGGGSVSEELLLHLERLIVTGALPPGAKLAPERLLAAELEVSRSALREALSRLEASRLIERRQGSGTRVAQAIPLTSALADHLTRDASILAASAEFRTVVEPQIARLAAARVDDAELEALARILETTHTTDDPDHSVGQDVAFHAAVARAARNPLLLSLSELTVSWTVETRIYSHLDDEGRRLSHDGHARILRALRARSADGAEAAMRVHLDEIAELIARLGTADTAS